MIKGSCICPICNKETWYEFRSKAEENSSKDELIVDEISSDKYKCIEIIKCKKCKLKFKRTEELSAGEFM